MWFSSSASQKRKAFKSLSMPNAQCKDGFDLPFLRSTLRVLSRGANRVKHRRHQKDAPFIYEEAADRRSSKCVIAVLGAGAIPQLLQSVSAWIVLSPLASTTSL